MDQVPRRTARDQQAQKGPSKKRAGCLGEAAAFMPQPNPTQPSTHHTHPLTHLHHHHHHHHPDNKTKSTMATPAPAEGGGLVKRTPAQVQAANLMILQRKDEGVSEILATATYVVIYVFEPTTKQWERKEVSKRGVQWVEGGWARAMLPGKRPAAARPHHGTFTPMPQCPTVPGLTIAHHPPLSPHAQIEGSLFVVKRSYGVRFRLVVLNRVNLGDLEQDLTGSFTFEDMSPYLLYRTKLEGSSKTETLAIWFHNEKDRTHIAGCLRKVLKLQSSATPQQQQDQQQQELMLSSAVLPPAPSVEEQQHMDGSASVSGSASTSGAAAAAGGGKKVTPIEELLLKAASIGGGGGGAGGASKNSSASGTPASSPRSVMDMLLKPQAVAGATTTSDARASRSISASSGGPALLNPLGLTKSMGNEATASAGPRPSSLDKQQLKEALLSLIDDDAFLTTLHQAYLLRSTRDK